MAKSSDPWSDRQQRHLSYISEFTTDIQHFAGKDNMVADALSRISTNTLLSGVNYETMATFQQQDVELQKLRVSPSTSLTLKDVAIGNISLICDTSGKQARPAVPLSLGRQVFETINNLAHPGVKATQRLISSKFIWHGLKKQVGTWAKQCLACQQSKIQCHVRAPLQTFKVPPRRFDHINIDIVDRFTDGFTPKILQI